MLGLAQADFAAGSGKPRPAMLSGLYPEVSPSEPDQWLPGKLRCCSTGLLAARAVQYRGQHRAALKADAAMLCVGVLQLAVGVAVPRANTGTSVVGL